MSGSIKGYMEAGASAVVLSDTIFENQLMRDGKFSEISELANLATLEALQFTKWDKSDNSTSMTDLQSIIWGVCSSFVTQPWCGLYVTSLERFSWPPKHSCRSFGAMHLQEAENAPNLCAANKDLIRGCCDAKKSTTHLGAAESPQLAREQRRMNGRVLVCLCFDWPDRCNADSYEGSSTSLKTLYFEAWPWTLCGSLCLNRCCLCLPGNYAWNEFFLTTAWNELVLCINRLVHFNAVF